MRARLESLLNDTWYGGRPPGAFLRGLESAYRRLQAVTWRRELANRAADLEGAPIIVVGNLTAGGAGKTPLVMHLCALLAEAGIGVGVVSRGYGRRGRAALRVEDGHSAGEAGDEPVLIHRRCRVPVMVGPDRVAAARQLFASGVEAVISDDGLQRLSLPRILEICVVDGQRGFGNGRMLPAGPLREPVSRLDSVDYVVCNGAAGQQPALQTSVAMRLEAADPVSLDGQRHMTLAELAARSRSEPAAAVAGIGYPERFFRLLERHGIRAAEHSFPDHHAFRREDFDDLGGRLVVMTEKDAVKCRDLGLADAWAVPVDARLPPAWDDEIRTRIRDLLTGPGA